MSREEWTLTKQHKSFNVQIYRAGIRYLIVSLFITTALVSLIYYKYLHIPERDYYATNGITAPVKLTALLAPNMTPNALLEPDPATDDVVRVIPQ